MASLSTHLRRLDDHGRLAFHPECPQCRERLAGSLSAEAAISRRAQALLAAGVLALSGATPTAALATEPDQEQEGAISPADVAAPDQAPQGDASDQADTPDSDPDSVTIELPFDVEPATQAPTSLDDSETGGESLEQDPTADGEIPVVDPGDGSGTPGPGQQQPDASAQSPPSEARPTTPKTGKPPAPRSPGGAATSPSTATPPGATAPTTGTPVGTDAQPPVAPDGATPSAPPDPQPESLAGAPQPDTVTNWERHAPPKRAAAPAPRPAPATTVSVAPAPVTTQAVATAPQAAAAQPAPRSAAQAPNRRAAQRGDRSYVVQPGDSLWSIARDALGDGASVARIAREVSRLWELNGERIGTGDRDLLGVGTRLVL